MLVEVSWMSMCVSGRADEEGLVTLKRVNIGCMCILFVLLFSGGWDNPGDKYK